MWNVPIPIPIFQFNWINRKFYTFSLPIEMKITKGISRNYWESCCQRNPFNFTQNSTMKDYSIYHYACMSHGGGGGGVSINSTWPKVFLATKNGVAHNYGRTSL